MRPADTRFPTAADASAPCRASPLPRHALLIDVEPATAELFAHWLAPDGWQMLSAATPADRVALIVIELAFPRQSDRQRLLDLAQAWPGVPVIVLSPTLLPGVSPQGEVARQLGAAAVLSAPVSADALRAAVARLGPPAA